MARVANGLLMPILPFGEYRPDVSDINAAFTRSLANVLPRADGYGPVRDFAALTAALPAACRGFFVSRDVDNSLTIFAATSTNLYKLNNTTLAWGNVSRGGGPYAVLSAGSQWQFAQFNTFVLATQANEALQVFTLGSSSAFADQSGSPPASAYIAIINRFVVLTGISGAAQRVQWSGLNDPAAWTPGINNSDYQDFPDGGPARTIGTPAGDIGIIMQDYGARRMVFAPGSAEVFVIIRISASKGILAPYSLVTAGERMFYLSPQGFVMSDASGTPNLIGKERVDRTILGELDRGNLQLAVGATDPNTTAVMFSYKSQSGIAGVFDQLRVYDWVLDRWSPIAMRGEYIATLASPGLTLEGLDAISGSIDALSVPLDSISTATLPALAMANPTHTIGYFGGATLEATLETPQGSSIATRMFFRGMWPVTDALTLYGSVGAAETPQGAATYTTEQPMNVRGFVPARRNVRYGRVKSRIPAGTVWTFATGVEPDTIQEGER